jgi:DNA-binding XRE family transcriptional regulator
LDFYFLPIEGFVDADSILDRMIKATGGKTQSDLGNFLGISQASVSEAKRKGKVPPEWFLKFSTEKKLNPNWLLRGEEPMYILGGQDAAGQDIETLEKFINILDGLEFALDERGREMGLDIKKGWIRYLYKRLSQLKPSEITKEKVEELIAEVDKLHESKKGDV